MTKLVSGNGGDQGGGEDKGDTAGKHSCPDLAYTGWLAEKESLRCQMSGNADSRSRSPGPGRTGLVATPIAHQQAVVAEWLRRWTWNPMGSPRAGSNPAGCAGSFWRRCCGFVGVTIVGRASKQKCAPQSEVWAQKVSGRQMCEPKRCEWCMWM